MVTTFTFKPSLMRIDPILQFRVIVVTDPQTHKQTGVITIHCVAALLVRSVNMLRHETDRTWFSRLVQHPARKWSESILITLERAWGQWPPVLANINPDGHDPIGPLGLPPGQKPFSKILDATRAKITCKRTKTASQTAFYPLSVLSAIFQVDLG